jgi:hypothetical protein
MTRIYWDGPALRRFAEHRLAARPINGRSFDGAVRYRYVGDDGRRAPAYWARRIQLTAFHVAMGEPLAELAQALREIPGCLQVTRHEAGPAGADRNLLRPQVRALYDRETDDADHGASGG